ncbi:MAG: UDP-N-acetylglucosamine--N-acetylmuramyl-(pentapeptide) pyrophosphoryl-undecaprenol N-acetylglucosamine transferase, partial [Maribacter sp.]|nr:UDP-N-acetylglucosamine--N-acetylmuramyl-(pentapeptide) pyrophosphoryl-undecaprenol N-acetylglucosamine transferase [Maribacter sp.]
SEKDLDSEFDTVFTDVLQSEAKQERLATNIKKLAMPNATKDIVDEIEKLLLE